MIRVIIIVNKYRVLVVENRNRLIFFWGVFGEWDILDVLLWLRIWVWGDGWGYGEEDEEYLDRVKSKNRGKELGIYKSGGIMD